jgi:polysaccharide biosynthesis/export protein
MSKLFIFIFSVILFSLSSCVTHQELINFRSGKEKEPIVSKLAKQTITNQADLKLQANDVLAIIIMSPDGVLSTPYNLVPTQLIPQVTSPVSPTTFLIGNDGLLHVPSIGVIKASGLTVGELREEIIKKVSVFLENPSVNIRLINFKISVQGEVSRPGTFQIPNERITILEALSEAGDLTPFSNRTRIIVIREHNGIREQGEINLKDTAFFTSPYYYLQQNDIVYVEPTKAKKWQTQQSTNSFLAPIGTAISLLTAIILIFKN